MKNYIYDEKFKNDDIFRQNFLSKAIDSLINDDLMGCKRVLREYFHNARCWTVIGKMVNKYPNNLHSLLKEGSNPTVKNLLPVIKALQDNENIKIKTYLAPKDI